MDVATWSPLVGQLRGYGRRSLVRDAIAGAVLSALLIPAGMGYATAAGLPAINGLYATIVPLVVYALVGPSRVMVLGPDSGLTPLIASAILALAATEEEGLAIAAMLAVLAGVICIVAALARFGFLADLLSKPVRYGYLNGIALIVIVSQTAKALGFSASGENLVEGIRDLWDGITGDLVNGWSLAIAVGSLAVILGCRRLGPRIPGGLIAMLLATVLVAVTDLVDRGVDVVGELPRGLPSPEWPSVAADDLGRLFVAALGIAFISFADTAVLSRTFAMKTGADVDANRELGALGAVNVATGFFQGFPVTSSQSRTPVAHDAGAVTQMTGIVGAAVVALVIVLVPGAFEYLPDAALAAVVIAAVARLVEVRGVVRLWSARRSEFVLSVAAFAAVALFGPIEGTGLAIALSLLNFMRKSWRPHTTELVRVDGLKGYHDSDRHPEGHRVPGLLLYRFDAPLFFANGGFFEEDLMRRVDSASAPVQWVVVTAEPITDVDSTAIDELAEVMDRLDERGVRLVFAELKGHVRDRLVPFGLVERIGEDRFYRTVGQAVHAYVHEHGVTWHDWEDETTGGAVEESGQGGGPATPPA